MCFVRGGGQKVARGGERISSWGEEIFFYVVIPLCKMLFMLSYSNYVSYYDY